MNATNVQERLNNTDFNTTGSSVVGGSNSVGGVMSKDQKTSEYRIKVAPIAFDCTTDSMFTTSIDLANTINSVFKKVFKDYYGAIISYVPDVNGMNWRWKASLYFRPNANASTDGTIQNIKAINGKVQTTDGSAPRLIDRIEGLGIVAANKHYLFTAETLQAVSKFMGPGSLDKQGNILSKFIVEEEEQLAMGYNSKTVFAVIKNVDVIALIKAIYGYTNEDNHTVDYMITGIRPIAGYGTSGNTLISIQRLDTIVMQELCNKVGSQPVIGTIPIIVA